MATTLQQVTDTIPTVISSARMTEVFANEMKPLVQNIRKPKGSGSTVNIPYFGVLTARTLTDGVDMTADEQLEDTNVQITLNEVGCKVILTDNVIEDDQEDLRSMAGNLLGQAIGAKQDADLLALLDNGTTSLCGTGSTLTMGHIAAARATAMGNAVSAGGPTPGPLRVILHPYQTLDLVDVVTPIVPTATYLNVMGGEFTDSILKQYTIGTLFGMPIIEDGNITIDSTPDAKGGVFGPKSIVCVTARDWSPEPERDGSLRAWEINCVGRYGVGNYLNGWTVELYSDATAPA